MVNYSARFIVTESLTQTKTHTTHQYKYDFQNKCKYYILRLRIESNQKRKTEYAEWWKAIYLSLISLYASMHERIVKRRIHGNFFSVLWSWSVQPLNRIYVPSAVWSKSARAPTRRFSQLLVNKSIEINQYARKNRFKHPCSDILFSDHRHMAVDAKSFDIYDASQKIMNS